MEQTRGSGAGFDVRAVAGRVGARDRLLGRRRKEKRPAGGADCCAAIGRELAGIGNDDIPLTIEHPGRDFENRARMGQHPLLELEFQARGHGSTVDDGVLSATISSRSIAVRA